MEDSKRVMRFFDFLKHKEGRNIPFIVKLIYAPETLRPEDLNIEHTLDLSLNQQNIELPEGLKINGNLKTGKNIKKLPNDLTINGMLDLMNSPIKEIPPTIKMKSLEISGSKITSIPENFKEFEYLSLRRSLLRKLPTDLKVIYLDISGNNISEIPNNVWGLLANQTNIKSIPDNKVMSYVSCLQCPHLHNIGDNLTIIGNFKTSNNGELRIGKNFKVDGEFHLNNVTINDFPLDIEIGKTVKILNSTINKLPDNLTINGNLELDYIVMKKLPNNLTVNGSLVIRGTRITEIPHGLKVVGDFICNDSPIGSFTEHEIGKKVHERGGIIRGDIIK